ncbi:hypothetical protein MWU65_07970 [Cellulophaga sp. F20128]|uniref:hypothetical protein n=1 Tax=Cellulophaga sp. F20128 TaxID=2926413 RepID=UPI001FF342BB|nr:hypothetical protein [Cellulophaga sp. F20128]MCK0157109.1 hypothetical protein [Cellulophaga sp. F20128]
MKSKIVLILTIAIHLTFIKSFSQAWDYNNNRIAVSADGNSAPDYEHKWATGDPDDWGANAAILAILAKMEMQDKLVHFSYNNFIDAPAGPDEKNQNKLSCDGGIIRWHFDADKFYDVTTQLEEAKNSLAREMVKSTAEDPLYFLHAGLSEFVYQAVEKAIELGGLENLKHVKLVSHSGFNENHKRREWHHTWEDIQKLCGNRIQYHKIKDQNACDQRDVLWCSGKDFSPWYWMRYHTDESINWLYTRVQAHETGKADISDCGLLYWLLTGDENGNPLKFKKFIGTGIPNAAQGLAIKKTLDANASFTLNAIQDFPVITIPGFAIPYKDNARKAMAIDAVHYKGVYAASKVKLTAPKGLYDITLTSLCEIDGESTYRLKVNGEVIGEIQNATTDKDYQKQTYTFKNVKLDAMNDIQVEFNSHSNGKIPEDDAFAFSRGIWTALTFHCIEKAPEKKTANNFIAIEGEHFDLHGEWTFKNDDIASGGKYIQYTGANSYEAVVEKNICESNFEVTEPGTYTVKWLMRQPEDAEGDKSNDAWINFPDAIQIGREPIKGFHKFVGRGKVDFAMNGQLDLHGEQPWMKVTFEKSGFYTLQLSGRSELLQIDKIVLYKDMSFEEALKMAK